MALVGKGDVKDARKELAAFDKEEKEFSNVALMGTINLAHVVAPIPRLLLEAQIAVAENHPKEAVNALNAAANIKDSLAYDEPEAWYIAPRETLGALLIKLGRFDDAEKVFRQDLAIYPREGRLLFGLKEALKSAGKTSEAALVEEDFNRAWERADTQLRLEDL